MIKIVGERKEFNFEEVDGTVVKIGTKYYWKISEDIVCINKWYYRKLSPFIVEAYNGEFILKADSVELDGDHYHKSSTRISKDEEGIIRLSRDIKKIQGKNYYKNSALIIKGYTNSRWYLRTDKHLVKLSEKYYDKDALEHRDYTITVDGGEIIINGDQVEWLEGIDGKVKVNHFKYRDNVKKKGMIFTDVYMGFKNENNPKPREIIIKKVALTADEIKENIISYEFQRNKIQILKSAKKRFDRANEFCEGVDLRESSEQVKGTMDNFFDDVDEGENTAKRISLNYQRLNGAQVYVNAANTPLLSQLTNLTGGIKNTFGVELETSAGDISKTICEKIKVDKVGDGSIGAAEYVSGIYHGNKGIEQLKEVCTAVAAGAYVDNRCGIHVHVGGYDDAKVVTPAFDIAAGVYLIKLGCQLEEELFSIMPDSRSPDLKYCASIKQYAGITMENADRFLGTFVFGPHNHALTDNILTSDMYKLGRKYNKQYELHRWCAGRYKWLNLVNCFSKSRFNTIELRLFSGTTVFDKVYNYVLLSLAFVNFAEKHRKSIDIGSVTLHKMITTIYKDSPEIIDQLLSFVALRKAKFNK